MAQTVEKRTEGQLRWTIEHALQNVPHYAALRDTLTLDMLDRFGVEDLPRLPLTTKGDLRAHPMLGMSAVPDRELVRVFGSSGRTGAPVLSGETHNDAQASTEMIASAFAAMQVEEGSLVAILHGRDRLADALAMQRGATRAGCIAFPLPGDLRPEHVDQIAHGNVRAICATPSQMITLFDTLQRAGIDPTRTALKTALLGGEAMSAALLGWIEQRFDIEVADIYGLAELGGPGVAMGQAALTITPGRAVAEIIDPDTGQPCPPGVEGELVLTTLTAEAFPLIRFRTGDIASMLPSPPSGEQVISPIAGRLDDVINIEDQPLLPTQVETEILALAPLSPNFRLLRVGNGRVEQVTVQAEGPSELAPELCARLATRFGGNLAGEIFPAGTLPHSDGRMIRIVDRRGQ